MTEMLEFFRETGRQGGTIGGEIAARNMTKAERIARAKKAAAASAKARSAKAHQAKSARQSAETSPRAPAPNPPIAPSRRVTENSGDLHTLFSDGSHEGAGGGVPARTFKMLGDAAGR